uniref:Facilitated trehalose transporter Tret1-2 homolog n=1 Tax=Cacopsylla melanoneura TaxID=428564 RepID=A0A8D9BNG4_9HEMI
MVFNSGSFREWSAALIANMMVFGLGTVTVWVSACRHYFNSSNPPLGPVSKDYISWTGSIPFLTAVSGLFIWGNLSERLGRKPTGFILGVPYTLMYAMMCVSHNQTVVLVARAIGGFANVGCIMCVTLYVKEISSFKSRDKLTNILSVAVVSGSLVVMILSSFLSYDVLHRCLLVWCIAYLVLFAFLPETPVYYIKQKDLVRAKQSLEWLRQTQDQTLLNQEIEDLRHTFISTSSIGFLDIFFNKYYLKTMLIGVFLQTCIYNVTGFSIFIAYSSQIFEEVSQDVTHISWMNITFAALELAGTLLTFLVSDLFGRRTYIVSSSFVLSAILFSLFLHQSLHLHSLNGVAVGLIYAFIVIFFAFCFPIMYIYFHEIISSESSNHIFTIMMFGKNLIWFGFIKVFYVVEEMVGIGGIFLLFSIGTLFIGLMTLTFPETKNKTIQALHSELLLTK